MQTLSWISKLVEPRFDWRLLQAFFDVAECGTFRAASVQRLFAINTSRARIEELERMAGCKLVTRKNEGISLTSEGEALMSVARAMADARLNAVAALLERARIQK